MVNTPALIVAVYLLVTTRLAGIRTAPAKYDEQIALALEILKDVAGKDSEHGGAEKADVDKCMREVRDQRWTQMDWFYNITAGSGLGVDEGLEEDVDTIPIEEEAESEQQLPGKRKLNRPDSVDQEYLQVGLGTMVRLRFQA